MNPTFELHPFPDDTAHRWHDIKLSSEIKRTNADLDITFLLEGNITDLILPKVQNSIPQRKNNLWETTCFEFFVGPKDTSQYWEVNLSPHQDWNIYHFSRYRETMTEESRIQNLASTQQATQSQFLMNCQFPLEPIELTASHLELSITTVLQKKTGEIGYWALTHSDKQADFHQRQSFIVTL